MKTRKVKLLSLLLIAVIIFASFGTFGAAAKSEYFISVLPDLCCFVDCSKINAAPGDTVSFTVTPRMNYYVQSASCTTVGGANVLLTLEEYRLDFTKKYSFVMPSYDVNISTVCYQTRESYYSDVSYKDWCYNPIMFVSERGIFSGYGGTDRFGTVDNIQRQDFLIALSKIDGVDLAAYANRHTSFPDVAYGSYYEAAVAWGSEKGIVAGYQNGRFGVGDPITREQLVTFFYRYAAYKGYTTKLAGDAYSKFGAKYSDLGYVSGYALNPMLWGLGMGVLSGKSGRYIDPSGNAQRCEVATMIYNISQMGFFSKDYVYIENFVGKNLNGYVFTLSSSWMPKSSQEAKLAQEKQLFEIIEQIEKQTGCTIRIVSDNMEDYQTFRNYAVDGVTVGDAVEVMASDVPLLAASGYITAWNKINGIKPNGNDFVSGYVNLGKVGNDYYGINWMRPPEARMCVVFNKKLLSSAGIDTDNIYTLVRNKQWDWNTFRDYAKRTTNAQKGIYGMGGYFGKIARALYTSNNAKLITDKAVGSGIELNYTYKSPKMSEALGFMNELINTDNVYDKSLSKNYLGNLDTSDNRKYWTQFEQGKCAMLIEETFFLAKYFKNENNFPYGIAPLPIGPSATDYITDASNGRVWVCPSFGISYDRMENNAAILSEIARRTASNDPTGASDYAGELWWKNIVKKDYFEGNSENANLEMYSICINSSSADCGAAIPEFTEHFTEKVLGKSIIMQEQSLSNALNYLSTYVDYALYNYR